MPARTRVSGPRLISACFWSKDILHSVEVFNSLFRQSRQIGGRLSGRTEIAALITLDPAKLCQILKLPAGCFSRKPAAISYGLKIGGPYCFLMGVVNAQVLDRSIFKHAFGQKASRTDDAEDKQTIQIAVEKTTALDKKPCKVLYVGWPSVPGLILDIALFYRQSTAHESCMSFVEKSSRTSLNQVADN